MPTDLRISVIDWTRQRTESGVRIIPTEWAKIIAHLKFLNAIRVRAH